MKVPGPRGAAQLSTTCEQHRGGTSKNLYPNLFHFPQARTIVLRSCVERVPEGYLLENVSLSLKQQRSWSNHALGKQSGKNFCSNLFCVYFRKQRHSWSNHRLVLHAWKRQLPHKLPPILWKPPAAQGVPPSEPAMQSLLQVCEQDMHSSQPASCFETPWFEHFGRGAVYVAARSSFVGTLLEP